MVEHCSTEPVALITGAGTGVGAACAKRMATRGFNVVVNFRSSANEAEAVVRQCQSVGVGALAIQGDVERDHDCRAIVEAARHQWGRVDTLINSAGLTQFTDFPDLEGQNAEDFYRIYGVNVIGAYQMARAAAPLLKRGGIGAVVNISSIAGMTGNGSSIAYVTSKGALNTLTKSLARLLAPEVRVNAILPGLIDSGWFLNVMGEEDYTRIKDAFAASSALGEVCSPDDIAQVAEFLAVDATRITGQLIPVDAGALLGAGSVSVSRSLKGHA
ncbi:3-oxoacyl-[acyl-carrier protein] reductase [Salinihabitans flavidus]|uniref:3-oxoacyl-[acyl-carrier protein] reductase n=2 Tax=Salinihabitans flavidus TaxID=569882 RepID=A0A1H8UP35_9RHOB|nr:3-oxoacyl-[acyl-carrier protein] reductase [Salinihabitans flavidus]